MSDNATTRPDVTTEQRALIRAICFNEAQALGCGSPVLAATFAEFGHRCIEAFLAADGAPSIRAQVEASDTVAAAPQPPLDAIRDAAGLAGSEARRWESHSDRRTHEHWQGVCIKLNAFLLAYEAMLALFESKGYAHEPAAPEPPACHICKGSGHLPAGLEDPAGECYNCHGTGMQPNN